MRRNKYKAVKYASFVVYVKKGVFHFLNSVGCTVDYVKVSSHAFFLGPGGGVVGYLAS